MGGGAMRTAANAAAFTGHRSTAARRAPIWAPVSIVHMAIDDVSAPLMAAMSSGNVPGHPAMVQWPAWDDWEFARGKEVEAAAVLVPLSRLVFGLTSTLEEAMEATANLNEAIEMVYFFSGNVKDSIKVSQTSDMDENSAILPSMPNHVAQAFSLIEGSPEAQVAILLFLRSYVSRKVVTFYILVLDIMIEQLSLDSFGFIPPEMNEAPNISIGKNLSLKGLFSEYVESPDEETSESSIYLTDIVLSIKVKVSELVSIISCFLQDFVGASSESHGTTNTRTSTSTSPDYTNLALGSSFVTLAVATILVVLVKRS